MEISTKSTKSYVVINNALFRLPLLIVPMLQIISVPGGAIKEFSRTEYPSGMSLFAFFNNLAFPLPTCENEGIHVSFLESARYSLFSTAVAVSIVFVHPYPP